MVFAKGFIFEVWSQSMKRRKADKMEITIYSRVIRQNWRIFIIEQEAKEPTLGQGRFRRFWRTGK